MIKPENAGENASSQKSGSNDSAFKKDYEKEDSRKEEGKKETQNMDPLQQLKKEIYLQNSLSAKKNFQFEMALRELNRSFKKDFQAWKNMLEHDRELMREMQNVQEADL